MGEAGSVEETKICPFCAETIKAEARICRYCGKDQDPVMNKAKDTQNLAVTMLVAIVLVVIGALLCSSGAGVLW